MTNSKQQTVVDRIVNLLNKEGFAPVLIEEEIKSFTEMEKERTINDYIEGRNSVINREIIPAEQYYNETYGGDK